MELFVDDLTPLLGPVIIGTGPNVGLVVKLAILQKSVPKKTSHQSTIGGVCQLGLTVDSRSFPKYTDSGTMKGRGLEEHRHPLMRSKQITRITLAEWHIRNLEKHP
jgi:hypothetical protein